MAPLKALVIGGGIAGPAAAYWLARAGADVTLIERAPQARTTGQQVDLREQGVSIMKKMGIEPAVRAACVHEPGVQLIDLHGRPKVFFPASHDGSVRQRLTSEFEIMRGDMVRILYDLTVHRANVRHLYNTTVDSFTQDDESDPNGKVHVRFHDGRAEDFDLVVGADGINSKTRRLMLGPDTPDPRHPLGGYTAFFSVRTWPDDSRRATFCFLPGKHVSRLIGTRKDCEELTRVYMAMRGKDAGLDAAHKSGHLAEIKEAWANLYQDGGWQCSRFVEALRHSPLSDDLYSTPFQEVRLPQRTWSQGRVVLIGDAAHCQTANGFGSSWGMVGAYVLVGKIAELYAKDKSSPTSAVVQGAKNFEDTFRPIATATHMGNEWLENVLTPRSWFGIWILYLMAAVFAYLRLDQSSGLDSKTSNWPLPEYPELDDEKTLA